MSYRHIFLAVLVIGALISGCGGTMNSKSPRSSSSVAKASPRTPAGPAGEFIAKVNAACRRIYTRFASVNGKSFAAIAHAAPGIGAYEKRVVGEMRKLKATSQYEVAWHSVLDELAILADRTTRLGTYSKSKAAKRTLAEIGKARLQIFNTASQAGFAGCGEIAQ